MSFPELKARSAKTFSEPRSAGLRPKCRAGTGRIRPEMYPAPVEGGKDGKLFF